KPVPLASVVCTRTTAGSAALTTSSRLIGADAAGLETFVLAATAGGVPSFHSAGSVGHFAAAGAGLADTGASSGGGPAARTGAGLQATGASSGGALSAWGAAGAAVDAVGWERMTNTAATAQTSAIGTSAVHGTRARDAWVTGRVSASTGSAPTTPSRSLPVH